MAGSVASRGYTAARLNAGAILTALLAMVIPGAGASLALHRPGQAGIPTRLALCFGLGYAVCALCGVVLEILHVLHAWTYLPLLALVTIYLFFFIIRVGRRPQWFQHTLRYLTRSRLERRTLPLDRDHAPRRSFLLLERQP